MFLDCTWIVMALLLHLDRLVPLSFYLKVCPTGQGSFAPTGGLLSYVRNETGLSIPGRHAVPPIYYV